MHKNIKSSYIWGEFFSSLNLPIFISIGLPLLSHF